MSKSPLDFLGKFTVFSLFLIEIAIAYPLLISNEMSTLSEIINNRTIVVIGIFLVLFDFCFSVVLNELYKPITSFLFKRQMLEYTYAKKVYKNGFYEVTGKPIKSYDGLPSDIKDSIDKLDKLYYNQKLPHFFDLVIAFMNSAIIFLLGFLQHNNQYLIIGFIMSVFFILFLTKTFLDIGNMIIIDYKSIFEE